MKITLCTYSSHPRDIGKKKILTISRFEPYIPLFTRHWMNKLEEESKSFDGIVTLTITYEASLKTDLFEWEYWQ